MLIFTILALSFRYTSALSIVDGVPDTILGNNSEATVSLYDAILNGIDCGCDRVSNLDVSEIKVNVYNIETDSNAVYSIDDAASEIFNRSDFNASQCTQLFVHGFIASSITNAAQSAKCTFSKITCDGIKPLAIIFDNSVYTGLDNLVETANAVESYKRAVSYIKSIGVKIGEFMVQLLEKVDRGKIDIIGHSLGGQIVGYVGETIINNTGIPLERIYAADPAGPCYADCPNEHIRSDQADLVVSFHCNAGEFGSNLNLADYDFYSRNGQNQEGCVGGSSPDILLRAVASVCSHEKCVPISLNPSIREGKWESVKCVSADSYLDDECADNESTLAGYRVTPTNSTGVYYFTPDEELECGLLVSVST